MLLTAAAKTPRLSIAPMMDWTEIAVFSYRCICQRVNFVL